jgi:hypothetical protein
MIAPLHPKPDQDKPAPESSDSVNDSFKLASIKPSPEFMEVLRKDFLENWSDRKKEQQGKGSKESP